MNSSPSPSSVSGFTLTELMMVLTVAGVLAMLALPSFSSLSQSQQVKNACFELYSLFSLTRSEAIKRNDNVTVEGVMVGGALDHFEVKTSGGTSLKTVPAPKGVNIRSFISGVETSISGVTYQRSGRSTFAGKLTLQVDAAGVATATPYISCITLELSGMPRIRKGACS